MRMLLLCLMLTGARRRMLSQLGVWTGPLLPVFMGFGSLGNLFMSQMLRYSIGAEL